MTNSETSNDFAHHAQIASIEFSNQSYPTQKNLEDNISQQDNKYHPH